MVRLALVKSTAQENWSPGNSDGPVTAVFVPCSYGLIHSRNTMSVRVGQFAGLDTVQKVANTLGISQNIPHGPATYIGSFETDSERFDRCLLRFSERRCAQASLYHRAN